MKNHQQGILEDLPKNARALFFALKEPKKIDEALKNLRDDIEMDGTKIVVGFGQNLVKSLQKEISGLTHFPENKMLFGKAQAEVLWLWLRDPDQGVLLHRSIRLTHLLSEAFNLEKIVDTFQYQEGRDLSGFMDGTENPQGADANAAALVETGHLQGSSFVAVQLWQHDFAQLAAMRQSAQDNAIGRRVSDNEELDDAPQSAHVKRVAQERFTPEAFVLRRSMPWKKDNLGGLLFVAFGKSFAAFNAQWQNMIGAEDKIKDALFLFTEPKNHGFYWCPPMHNNKLDLSLLGIV